MKSRIRNILSRYKWDFTSILIIWAFTVFFLNIFYHIFSTDLRIPISYNGGDDFAYLVNVKMIQTTGWISDFARQAMPYGSDSGYFTTTFLFNFDNFGLKVCEIIFKEVGLTVNMYFFILFFMIGTISYIVMRCLSIKRIWSIGGAITYAFMPYIMYRNMLGHLVLCAYEFIPLSVLLCFWLNEDDNYFNLNKNFFKYRRNIISIFLLFLIANNGIGYYPFFTCFFLAVTGFIKTLRRKSIKPFLRALFLSGFVVLFMMISMLPNIITSLYADNGVSVVRTRIDAEIYGLKIIQLILPTTGHIDTIINAAHKYMGVAPLINENITAYLGPVAIVGFIALIISLFAERNEKNNRIKLLADLNIAALLIGTIGGFSMVLSLMGFTLVRSYNRISIYIAFFAILTVGFLLSKLELKKWVFVIIFALYLFGVYEQVPQGVATPPENKINFESDAKFVKGIENSLNPGDMVYQFPFHLYPESGPVKAMFDYSLFRGYIHSNTIRWSYGAINGQETANWEFEILNLPMEEKIHKIIDKGYKGIYIDVTAYDEAGLKELTTAIEKVLGTQSVISDNKLLMYYPVEKK